MNFTYISSNWKEIIVWLDNFGNLPNIRARNAESTSSIRSFKQTSAIMFTEVQKIQLINQLTQSCAALLIIDMDEQDRQIIFEHIQEVVNRLQILLNDFQPRM